MDKLKNDVMQQSEPEKNHLNTNYPGLPLICSCRYSDLCIVNLKQEVMIAAKRIIKEQKNIENQEKVNLLLICVFPFSDLCTRIK